MGESRQAKGTAISGERQMETAGLAELSKQTEVHSQCTLTFASLTSRLAYAANTKLDPQSMAKLQWSTRPYGPTMDTPSSLSATTTANRES
eukprot:5869046-Pleurochrysis_carterae.AAC.1